jgi:hypothetical protein
VGRQDHHNFLADLCQKIEKTVPLFRIEAGGGLVHDDELGLADQGLGDAETLAHAAGKAGDGLLADRPEIDLVQQGLDRLPPLGAVGQTLQDGEVVQEVEGRDPRVDPEVLGKVAKGLAQARRLGQDVDPVEVDGARGRGLEGGDAAHQGRLARAVRPQEAEHARRDLKADVVEGAGPSRIDVAQVADRQHGRLLTIIRDVARSGFRRKLKKSQPNSGFSRLRWPAGTVRWARR